MKARIDCLHSQCSCFIGVTLVTVAVSLLVQQLAACVSVQSTTGASSFCNSLPDDVVNQSVNQSINQI